MGFIIGLLLAVSCGKNDKTQPANESPQLSAEETEVKALADDFINKSDTKFELEFDKITSRDSEWLVWYNVINSKADPAYRIVIVDKTSKKCRWGGAK